MTLKLTITGINSHSSSRSCSTAREESPIEGWRLPRTGLTQTVQVREQRKVDDWEGHVPESKTQQDDSDWKPNTEVTGLTSQHGSS